MKKSEKIIQELKSKVIEIEGNDLSVFDLDLSNDYRAECNQLPDNIVSFCKENNIIVFIDVDTQNSVLEFFAQQGIDTSSIEDFCETYKSFLETITTKIMTVKDETYCYNTALAIKHEKTDRIAKVNEDNLNEIDADCDETVTEEFTELCQKFGFTLEVSNCDCHFKAFCARYNINLNCTFDEFLAQYLRAVEKWAQEEVEAYIEIRKDEIDNALGILADDELKDKEVEVAELKEELERLNNGQWQEW